MFPNQIQAQELTAAEAREHLSALEMERALAVRTGVASIDAYLEDLTAEIAVWREYLTLVAVTEVATLRAELFGADQG
jgi:hypothetical protein